MAYQDDNQNRGIFNDTSIADERQKDDSFRGIQPKNQFAYKAFRFFRLTALIIGFFSVLLFGLTFVKTMSQFTSYPFYRWAILIGGGITVVLILLTLLIKLIFLRKCPFDDWVFEVAQRALGTDLIFYTSRCLYIKYDIASAKEVDKRDFVTQMSDLSLHYSYFYVNTFPDQQVIQVECTKKQPIPKSAVLEPEDDLFANIVPVGLTINNASQKVSPIAWVINDNKKNPNLLETPPSVSFLIAGGPLSLGTIIPTTKGYKTIETIEAGDEVFDVNNKPVEVLGKSEIFNSIQNYQLTLKNNNDIKKICCSGDHRFPVVINNIYSDVQCKDINVNDEILGNFYNYTVISKKNIQSISTQCILIDSKEHEFLITDKIEEDWSGGQEYTYPAVYARNTGCHGIGEEILIINNLITDIKDV